MFFPFFTLLFAYFYYANRDALPKLKNGVHVTLGVVLGIASIAFLAMPFLPFAELINGVWIIGIVFSLALGSICWFYFKQKTNHLLYVILAVAILRIAFDFTYHQIVVNNPEEISYRTITNELMAASENNGYELTGEPVVFESDASIGPLNFGEVTLTTPPHICYELAYYYYLSKKEPLEYTSELQPGKYYLAFSSKVHVPKEKIIYTFIEGNQCEMMLFKN